MVAARNYLVHHLLFDHGGRTGVPGLDSPGLYRKLYDPINESRVGTRRIDALRVLSAAEDAGWGQHTAFADLDGWSLTDSGKLENERQLMSERVSADPDGVVAAVYRTFLPLKARLLRAVADWQIKPTEADQFASNDHSDSAWDGRVLDELTSLGTELGPLLERLSVVLARFDGYTARYESVLHKAKRGNLDWIDKTDVDSCHRVWFQLHEDFIATLGLRQRGRNVKDRDALCTAGPMT